MEKRYTGTCYIGVVGPGNSPDVCLTSIVNIQKREGDEGPRFLNGTKGYVSRQILVDTFMESDHDFVLLLDHDMVYEPDTLEKLRSHELPFVSGYYLRRQASPIYSVWYHPFSGEWPHENFLDDPEQDRLYELGGSGWGCMLVHRDVFTETRENVLKGELDIIEDDMDVWPYDLGAVLRGEEELRPLRVVKDEIVGSDIRFPFYAAAAGFPLYGDASVRPRHMLNFELSPDEYSKLNDASLERMKENGRRSVEESRAILRAAREALA